jgi:hypothetical protein
VRSFLVIGNIFRPPEFFLRAANRKNEAVFRDFFEMVNLNEFFYVTKVIEKILWGVFLIGRIVNFHFHPNKLTIPKKSRKTALFFLFAALKKNLAVGKYSRLPKTNAYRCQIIV